MFHNFGVQSHHHSQFRRSEPSSFHSFGIQSRISISAFRATIILSFGTRSHHRFTVSAFRAASQFWLSKPPSFLVSTFIAIIISQFRSSESHLQFQRSKPPSLLILAFKAASPVRRSEPLSLYNLAFRVTVRFTVWHYDRAFIDIFSAFRVTFLAFKAFIFFSLAFRATFLAFRFVVFFQFSIQIHSFYLELLSSVLGVQSRVFSLAFRAIISFSLAFRVVFSF